MAQNTNNIIQNNLNNTTMISLDDAILNMKSLLTQYINMGLYANALFYADKIVNLSLNKELNVISDHLFDLAQCFYLNKEYYRCVNLIQKYNLTYYNLKFLNLLGQALMSCEDYEAVITYLDKDSIIIDNNEQENTGLYQSIRHLIIGKAYEMQENKPPATRNYIKALQYDPSNIEAFDILITHNLLSSDQKLKLVKEDLVFDGLNKWMHDYYLSKVHDNIYLTEYSDVAINEEKMNIIDILYVNNDQDLMKMDAEKFFHMRDYSNAFKKLKKYIYINHFF